MRYVNILSESSRATKTSPTSIRSRAKEENKEIFDDKFTTKPSFLKQNKLRHQTRAKYCHEICRYIGALEL